MSETQKPQETNPFRGYSLEELKRMENMVGVMPPPIDEAQLQQFKQESRQKRDWYVEARRKFEPDYAPAHISAELSKVIATVVPPPVG